MKTRFFAAGGLLVLLLALACDQPAPVANDVSVVEADFMNGPPDLPNVFRGDSILLFVWADVATDLVIVVNAPAGGVHALVRCGGTVRPDPQPVQTVGEFQDVARQLRLLRDVNIHLYRPVPPGFAGFADLCQATPFAVGTGNLTSTDNDRHVTGDGANAFGFRAEGIVDFADGGSAGVTAESERLIKPDGTREVLVSNVVLHPR
jgi:hypothetical protein